MVEQKEKKNRYIKGKKNNKRNKADRYTATYIHCNLKFSPSYPVFGEIRVAVKAFVHCVPPYSISICKYANCLPFNKLHRFACTAWLHSLDTYYIPDAEVAYLAF